MMSEATAQAGEPSPHAQRLQRNNRTPLFVAGLIAFLWIAGLIALVVFSANPVTLNRRQILESDYVVTATRLSAETNTLVVTKEWKLDVDLGEISVANLDRARMPVGTECLVPLIGFGGGGFRVTESALPNQAPLIYPETPEAVLQLDEILSSGQESR